MHLRERRPAKQGYNENESLSDQNRPHGLPCDQRTRTSLEALPEVERLNLAQSRSGFDLNELLNRVSHGLTIR